MLAIPATWMGWNQATHNFGVVQPGRIYRSGQMPALALARTVRERQIRTVVNLRGPNPRESWYREEVGATLAEGATQVDIPMSSCVWMSRIQLCMLVRVLDTCDYPLLIHCAWGSERTGLASAVAELLRPSATLVDVRGQLAVRYLYVRLGDGRIMTDFLDQYEDWLRRTGSSIGPRSFDAGPPRSTGPASRTARSGLTILCPWWSSRVPARPINPWQRSAPGRSP